MSDSDDGEIPPAAFGVVFLAAPLVLALVIVVVQYGHGLGNSPLALALVLGHGLAGLAFVVFYALYRRSR